MVPDSTSTMRLVYVEDCWAWFADVDWREVWGDDWNDAPHDCNAGMPYARKGQTLVKVAFDGDLELVGIIESNDRRGRGRWGYLSVEDINSGGAPWLVSFAYGHEDPEGRIAIDVQIDAGVSLPVFEALVDDADGSVYRVEASHDRA